MERHGSELTSEGLQYAEQIREGTRQMSQLVEDLLHFSRVTGQELERHRIDLTELANQVVAEIEQDLEDRTVDFRIEELGECDADPILLKQVLTNLLENAVKFTRPRKKAIVKVYTVTKKGRPVYVVSDNGVGFEMEVADRLFTVFQRFHQPEEFEGSGVGLAVVKRIVNRHGGEVWAKSRVNKGTKFYFTLGDAEGEEA
jgi:signal transduction histidine kinase